MARNPELERAIAADPGSLDLRLVYADWLCEQGDPFGELMALELRRLERKGGEPPPVAELREEDRLVKAVYGDLKGLGRPHLRFTTELGCLAKVTVGGGGRLAGDVLGAVLAHRTSLALRRLEVLTAPHRSARWPTATREDLDERATVRSIWAKIAEVGLPATVREARLFPPPRGEEARLLGALAGIESLAWPLRAAPMLTALRQLRKITFVADHVAEVEIPLLADVIAAFPGGAFELEIQHYLALVVRQRLRADFPQLHITQL